MDISKEQIAKLFELAGITAKPDDAVPLDISKALVSIEQKLNFFDTNINFESNNDKRNVLIVDDLELSIYQLSQLLKKIGITPSIARNKDEAVAELRKKSFNYLIVDLFLPDSKDGFDLINEAVKLKNEHKSDLQILVISGTDDKSLIDNCYKLGADSYIAKSEMWHTDVLKFVNSTSHKNLNPNFSHHIINSEVISYVIKKFNNKKIYDDLMADINSSMLSGHKNILLNVENISVFDADNVYVFAEIYKICAANKGQLAMINPSDKIKEALSFAYLDGIIPVFSSVEAAMDYINQKV